MKDNLYRGLYKIEPIISNEKIIAGREYFQVTFQNGNEEIIGVWEYNKMYKHPFLYDIIFGDILNLNAPAELISFFNDEIEKIGVTKKFRVLELAAGSGLAGAQIKMTGKAEILIGVDILVEAKIAALRDQPGVYDRYYVENLEKLPNDMRKELSNFKFNCFFVTTGTGGADDESGYKDVMLQAYKQAIKLLIPESYIFFNIRQKHTSGQELILDYLNTRCRLIAKKICPFRKLIDGTEVYAEFIIMQLIDSEEVKDNFLFPETFLI